MTAEKVLEKLKLWLGREYWKAEGVCEFLDLHKEWLRGSYYKERGRGMAEILDKIAEFEGMADEELATPPTEETTEEKNEAPQEGTISETAEDNSNVIYINDLQLSPRTKCMLKANGILTLHQLTDKTEDELLLIRSFGKKALLEVKATLEKAGLQLRSETWT